MPNTKSAERRMRNSARKNLRNRSAKSRLHTLEVSYLELLAASKKDDAAKDLRGLSSAFDKAVKAGIVHRATADRNSRRARQCSIACRMAGCNTWSNARLTSHWLKARGIRQVTLWSMSCRMACSKS